MSTPSERLVGPGDVLCDRFTLDREIGRGAVSRVFHAQDQLLGSVLALKVIRKAEAPVELAGFRTEVALGRRVTHPNVVRLHDLHRDPVFGWFVSMELVEGRTLKDEAEVRRFAPDEVATIGAQLAAGLAALHLAGVVHRDVKPGNVLLSRRRVVLVDLGIAAPLGSKPTGVAGTPTYMSAGQRDQAEVAGALDLYALGVLLYELATAQKLSGARLNTNPGRSGDRSLDLKALGQVAVPLQQVIVDLLATQPDGDAEHFARRLARLPAGLRSSTPPSVPPR
jgi:serine/threonine-protein kinase